MDKEKRGIPFVYLKTPNGIKLASYHRHDFKSIDESGETFFIDGGQNSFIRIGGKCNVIHSTIENEIEWVRGDFEWTSYTDKKGIRLNEPITKKLKDLDINHVKTLIEYTSNWTSKLMEVELKYREKYEL